jgi:MinD-like ATPase involved in chromosome partitioning or flagellar assembly
MRDPLHYPPGGGRLAERARFSGSRTVAVGGGLLGMGSSTIAALLALAAATRGRETLLVDADPEGPPLARLLGLRDGAERLDVEFAASGAGQMLRVRDALHLLRPASRETYARFRRDVFERFDVVVVDTGWRMDSVLETCATGVDRVLVVTTPGRAALSASYGLIKTVEAHVPGTRFEVLVNQQDVYAARHSFGHLQTAALHFLHRTVGLAGVIPEDACLRAGTRGGMRVEDAAAESHVAQVIEQLMTRILAERDHARLLPPVQRPLLRGA